MTRSDISTKKLLTEPTFVSQDDRVTTDTTGSETVTRTKTVRSAFQAFRRLMFGATAGALHLETLDGKMLRAVRALGGNPTAETIIDTINDAVTGAGAEPATSTALSATSFVAAFSDVTVVRDGGGFSIDDMGESTGLLRAPRARSLKFALRRVVADVGTGGPFFWSTLSGASVNALAALTAGSATGTQIIAALDAVANETSDSADLTASTIGGKVPSLSNLALLASTMRKRSGSNRDVVLDNTGSNTDLTDVAGSRYSVKKTLFDMASTDGLRTFTTAGDALAAVAALDSGTASIEDIINAIKGAVE